jgi:hypothetical protein
LSQKQEQLLIQNPPVAPAVSFVLLFLLIFPGYEEICIVLHASQSNSAEMASVSVLDMQQASLYLFIIVQIRYLPLCRSVCCSNIKRPDKVSFSNRESTLPFENDDLLSAYLKAGVQKSSINFNFGRTKKLSENDLPGFIIVRKLPVKTPATADRRGWCFHQPQNGRCFFIFRQLLTILEELHAQKMHPVIISGYTRPLDNFDFSCIQIRMLFNNQLKFILNGDSLFQVTSREKQN